MELRALDTPEQRGIFGERLARARASVGMRFKEKSRSQLARIQLMFADLYALYQDEEEPADAMIAGLAMHDLEMFPQTCPRPDLSHLQPSSIIEMSDFWSLSPGAGSLVWCGAAVAASRTQPRAALVYMVVGDHDRTSAYLTAGFVKAGEPFPYPYLETLDGADVLVQALVLEGDAMQRLIKVLSRMTAGAADARGAIRMKDFLGISSQTTERPLFSRPAQIPVQPEVRTSAGLNSFESVAAP
jgi:beta-phosphoglucomutase-like phosphatase (HAD superfamily)